MLFFDFPILFSNFLQRNYDSWSYNVKPSFEFNQTENPLTTIKGFPIQQRHFLKVVGSPVYEGYYQFPITLVCFQNTQTPVTSC